MSITPVNDLDEPPFRATRAQHDAQVTVRLFGELDIATVDLAEAAVLDADLASCREVTLDLQDLRFIDCTGIGLLIRLESRSHADGWRLQVRTPDAGPVWRATSLCGLADRLDLVTVSRVALD